MKFAIALFAGLLAGAMLANSAQAQITIVAANTSNTGQDGSGNLLADGSADPIWKFVAYDNSYGFNDISYAPVSTTSNAVPSATTTTTGSFVPVAAGPAYVVTSPPGAWAPATGTTKYISATPNQAIGGMPGTFEYQFSFDSPIDGIVTFSGTASADNGLRIVFNGTTEATFGGQLVMSTDPGWVAGLSTSGGSNATIPAGGSVYGAGAAPFSFSAPITAGTNTLDFFVSNFDDAPYGGDEEGLYVTNFAITVVPEPRDYAVCFLAAVVGLSLLRRRSAA